MNPFKKFGAKSNEALPKECEECNGRQGEILLILVSACKNQTVKILQDECNCRGDSDLRAVPTAFMGHSPFDRGVPIGVALGIDQLSFS
jgi:hypothetical protein